MNESTSYPNDRQSRSAPVFEWLRALRGCELTITTVGVLTMLATYADWDGRNAYPGEERLAADTNLSVRSVRRHLETARLVGWISRDETSGHRARGRGLADRYMLTIPHGRVSEAVAAPAAAVDTPPSSTGHQRPVDSGPAPDGDDASTGHEPPQAPDATVRPPTHVPTQGPIPRARAAERAAVVDALTRVTGKGCTDEHADAVIRDVLAGRTITHRAAYLRAAVERQPERYRPTPVPPRFVREAVAA